MRKGTGRRILFRNKEEENTTNENKQGERFLVVPSLHLEWKDEDGTHEVTLGIGGRKEWERMMRGSCRRTEVN